MKRDTVCHIAEFAVATVMVVALTPLLVLITLGQTAADPEVRTQYNKR